MLNHGGYFEVILFSIALYMTFFGQIKTFLSRDLKLSDQKLVEELLI